MLLILALLPTGDLCAQFAPQHLSSRRELVKGAYGGSAEPTAYQIDENGLVIGVSAITATYRQLSPNLESAQALAVAPVIGLTSDDPIEILAAEAIVYNNTTPEGSWYHPGPGYEMLDYGTTTGGGTVTKFKIAYVTSAAAPGSMNVKFYSGTDSSTCPGTFLAGWVFNGLPGSGLGLPLTFIIDVTLTPEEHFDLPAGPFGYSYEFTSASTGAYVARGGQGNQDGFWRNCLSFWFGGTPWAGFYMQVTAAQGGGGPGETCDDPIVIGALDFNDTGNTCNYINDYDRCISSGSGDVVYQFTPAAHMDVRISLCSSAYDTALYVIQDDCNNTEIACNDDYCGVESELPSVLLSAGTTYYIVVDGWGGECGDYSLTVQENLPCSVTCPPGAAVESESCGADVNGGCASGPSAFSPINLGDSVCGTVWATGGTRDMDWYRVYVPDPLGTGDVQLTWTVASEFPAALSIATDDCGGGQVLATGYGRDCQAIQVSACVPGDANYVLSVSPGTEAGAIFEGIACGGVNNYLATADYKPCPTPDIRIDPEWLGSDCDDGGVMAAGAGNETPSGQTSSVAAMPLADPQLKLIGSDRIARDMDRQGGVAQVIVNLAEPVDLRDQVRRRLARRVRNPRAAAWRNVRNRVTALQGPVLSSLRANDFALIHRFENQAGFSGFVTQRGIARLLAHPAVESVEPVIELQAHLAQAIPLMNAQAVRSTHNGQGLSIAICDTGIDYNHQRLGNGGFPNAKVLGGYDFGDDDADPIPNSQSHGTSCAGIAAGDLGTVGDYIGGVAHNAKLYALKISTGSTGSATSDAMIAAWDWCVTHQWDDPCNPIMIISTSFGGGQYFSACDPVSPGMTTAAADAALAGITLFASSANDGYCDSMAWPACIDGVISVGAVYDAAFGTYQPCISGLSCADKTASTGCTTGFFATDQTAPDMVTSYSNTASFLDILAPANQSYTLNIGGYTSSFGGTSAACPYAAGAAACLQSAVMYITGDYLSPAQVRATLIATGDPVTDSKVPITKPRVNLDQAVNMWDCPGQAFVVYNDGNAVLDVTAVNAPAWADVTPAAPFSVDPGSQRQMCVQMMDCNDCPGFDLARQVEVYSNDLDENPYPNGVILTVDCPQCGPPGDLDTDCDEESYDYALFIQQWDQQDCATTDWCAGADITRDQIVNLLDLIAFSEDWLVGVLP